MPTRYRYAHSLTHSHTHSHALSATHSLSHSLNHSQAEGSIANSKSQLVFEMQPVSSEEEEPTGVTTALISVASRPGVLDQGALPKVLTPLGGEPLIWHVLRQLALGGITHAVLILGARGLHIRSALEARPPVDPAVMTLEFVDLGEQYAAGFACSLLEARDVLGHRPFLLCTPDHIFDPKIIRLVVGGGVIVVAAVAAAAAAVVVVVVVAVVEVGLTALHARLHLRPEDH